MPLSERTKKTFYPVLHGVLEPLEYNERIKTTVKLDFTILYVHVQNEHVYLLALGGLAIL